MAAKTVRLGFEVGRGAPVDIPLKHMAVTGMTQEAGKTTALEALIKRSGLRAVTFVTKRGEQSFRDPASYKILPFFRERADWQFIASLIDATMGDKNKILRSSLMKVCRNTKTLADVQRNVATAKVSARGFQESLYTEIEGYLELVVPQLAQLPPAHKVQIFPGLNVMDLSPYRPELQGLVMRSVIEHVYEHETDVITVIPEAWEFLPEGRGSPVKLAAETLIRKGAALRNYMWVDAQDLGGLWKTVVRACAVYLVGVQREANEVKRTLANLPASTPKLKPADVASLGLGEFFTCYGQHAIKTYVQPIWIAGADAAKVARGELTAETCRFPPPKHFFVNEQHTTHTTKAAARRERQAVKEDSVTKDEAAKLERENRSLLEDNRVLRGKVDTLERLVTALEDKVNALAPDRPKPDRETAHAALEASRPAAAPNGDWAMPPGIYEEFKARLVADAPAIVRVMAERPELELTISRPVLSFEEHSMKWRLLRLLADGYFEQERRGPSAIRSALKRTGPDANTGNIARAMDDLVKAGVFTDEGSGYLAVPGMKVTVLDAAR